MKLIVAGGRDYHLTPQDFEILSIIVKQYQVTEIVQGGGTLGAYALQFTRDIGLDCKEFPLIGPKFDPEATPIQNKNMAEYADAVLLFSGGKGTKSMLNIARTHKLKIFISKDFKTT